MFGREPALLVARPLPMLQSAARNRMASTTRVTVLAKPRASRSQIRRCEGLSIEVALAAPPADGAANEELVTLVASALSLRRSAVTIVLGHTSKRKVLEIASMDAAEVELRLAVSALATR